MEVKGKNYLNKMAYKSIKINLRDNNYSVKVTPNGVKLKSYLDSKMKFTDEIQKFSEDEQIYEIVNRFLIYSKIDCITEDYYKDNDNHFKYKYIKVSGEYRNLFLQLKNNDISKKILSNVTKKYNFDRDNYIYKLLNDEDNLNIIIRNNTNKIAYNLNEYGSLYIDLNKVDKLDQKFLETLIEYDLENNNCMYNKLVYFRKKFFDEESCRYYHQNYEICFNINNHRYCIQGVNNCEIVDNILTKYINKDFYNSDNYQLKLDLRRK